MHRTTSRTRVTLALTVLKTAVLSSFLAFTAVGTTASVAPAPPEAATIAMDPYAHAVQSAMAEHDCSTTGFAPGVQPASALIRTPRGTLELVSFDRGWEVFTGDRAGLLVAVCLDERPRH
ncbi:hypothetical protein [Nocardioides sp. SYSU DS0663]|uniref:hypothetical protein n=1 Tax=Nocardioides sp. SYSU DS0663 TaxID=3416445 RepID=UPI003F4C5827